MKPYPLSPITPFSSRETMSQWLNVLQALPQDAGVKTEIERVQALIEARTVTAGFFTCR